MAIRIVQVELGDIEASSNSVINARLEVAMSGIDIILGSGERQCSIYIEYVDGKIILRAWKPGNYDSEADIEETLTEVGND